MNDSITPRQLTAVAFVSILSPLIRRFPRILARDIGRTTWLSVIFCFFICAVAAALLYLIYYKKAAPYGLRDIFAEAVGNAGSKILTVIYTLWLVFCGGFSLRAFAQRFISTVYSGTSPALFIVVMAIACLPVVLGTFKALARSAMVFRLVMAGIFILVFVLSLPSLDWRLLLPVTEADVVPNIVGGAEIANVLGLTLFLAFAADKLEKGYKFGDWALWLFILFACIESMCVGCLAMLGHEMTANTAYPFFVLARDITILGSLESIEAFVIGVWVLSDFVMISAFWLVASDNLVAVFSPGSKKTAFAIIVTAAAVAVALFTGRSEADFIFFSDKFIPGVNAAVVLSLIPVGLLAVIRRRIKARRAQPESP